MMSIKKAIANLAATVFLAISAIGFGANHTAAQYIYTVETAELRAGPSVTNPIIMSVPARSPVYLQGCFYGSNWCAVVCGNARGYVARRYLSVPVYVYVRYFMPYDRPHYAYYLPGYIPPPPIGLGF